MLDTKSDPHIALLQIISTLLGLVLPNPAKLLFNHTIRGIMPTINRPVIDTKWWWTLQGISQKTNEKW